MSLQEYLINKFKDLTPDPPRVEERSTRAITLSFSAGPFSFLQDKLLYKVQKKDKIPPWATVYSGGKTSKTIDNLASTHPHKFRVKVIIKPEAVPLLAELAIKHFDDEPEVQRHFKETSDLESEGDLWENIKEMPLSKVNSESTSSSNDGSVGGRITKQYLESLWSDVTWTSTDSDGSSAACFCMAVRCGYLKQVQQMLEQRPELISVINNSSGLTPLATAARKGDLNMVKFLLSSDAEVNQRCSTDQTPLHLAVLAGHTAVGDLLLERGADFQARDINGLRTEHYAVDAGSVEVVRWALDRGGQLDVRDSNDWTPLFRAVCQGAKTEVIRELIDRGSDLNGRDRAGLTLVAVARVLRNRHGRPRDSILKLVDSQYQYEKAVANFTRLTKKIASVNSLLGRKL